MYLLFAMLSLNFFLILNLPHLINQCFHFYEVTIFQCPSFFISYIVIAFYAHPLLNKAVISLTDVVYAFKPRQFASWISYVGPFLSRDASASIPFLHSNKYL